MLEVPFCWKCASCRKLKNNFGLGTATFVMVGCKDEPKITDYESAKLLCPIIDHPPE